MENNKIIDILNSYIQLAPSQQTALDIFSGEWSSYLPEPFSNLMAGQVPLFNDDRISWFAEQINSNFEEFSVLELGPLEGGHSYMFEQLGAKEITAIEANSRAFLKCLIIKEILNLKRVSFKHGDFVEYLRETKSSFDVCVASGVLYHMKNPVELIALLAKCCTNYLCVWTHYYDNEIITENPKLAPHFTQAQDIEYKNFSCTLHKQEYQDALDWSGFCGGSASISYWMTRDDILSCLDFFGFEVLGINFDHLHHQNGPSLALVAKKKK